MSKQPTKTLTIGGWDPCGAFGTAADLKTFTAHQCHGMAILTVATAQNSKTWLGAQFLPAEFVAQQLDAVLSDYGADGVKSGFLGRVDLIEVIVESLTRYQINPLVVDPVLVNNRGVTMFGPEVIAAYLEKLMPLAEIITPNVEEARVLLGREPLDESISGQLLAQELQQQLAVPHVLITGEREGMFAVDWWSSAEGLIRLPRPWQQTRNVSGSGDTFSAALVCQLAQGRPMGDAIIQAQAFVQRAIGRGKGWQLGQGAGPTGNIAV